MKNHGYHLEHNFGHGKQHLAQVFVLLNLLAFAFHTVCDLNYAQVHLGPLGNLFYNSRDAELALREPLPRSHPNGG
jgi:hypothetical protein